MAYSNSRGVIIWLLCTHALKGTRASWEKSAFRTETDKTQDEAVNLLQGKNVLIEGWGHVKGHRGQHEVASNSQTGII